MTKEKRTIVSIHHFEDLYASIVKEGAKSPVFRVEYHIGQVWQSSDYEDENGNYLEEPVHHYKDVKIYHIIHEETGIEIPFSCRETLNTFQPTFSDVLQNLVQYGLEKGTVIRE